MFVAIRSNSNFYPSVSILCIHRNIDIPRIFMLLVVQLKKQRPSEYSYRLLNITTSTVDRIFYIFLHSLNL